MSRRSVWADRVPSNQWAAVGYQRVTQSVSPVSTVRHKHRDWTVAAVVTAADLTDCPTTDGNITATGATVAIGSLEFLCQRSRHFFVVWCHCSGSLQLGSVCRA